MGTFTNSVDPDEMRHIQCSISSGSTFTNSEDQDEMLHIAAFHQGDHIAAFHQGDPDEMLQYAAFHLGLFLKILFTFLNSVDPGSTLFEKVKRIFKKL